MTDVRVMPTDARVVPTDAPVVPKETLVLPTETRVVRTEDPVTQSAAAVGATAAGVAATAVRGATTEALVDTTDVGVAAERVPVVVTGLTLVRPQKVDRAHDQHRQRVTARQVHDARWNELRVDEASDHAAEHDQRQGPRRHDEERRP
jgi:hypothetical protein